MEENLESSEKKQPWYMNCPKCGGGMTHTSLNSVNLEKCTGCRGVFLDRAQLTSILEAREPHRFLDTISRIFDPGPVNPNLF